MLRVALVGRNKDAKRWIGRYLWYKHKFTHKKLIDPIDKFVKGIHYYEGRRSGKMFNWYEKWALYDFLYEIEPEIFVKLLEARLTTQRTDVVVSDVRYLSELEYMRDKLGFTIVRVNAPVLKFERITQKLGRNYKPGTLLLLEKYGTDFTEKVQADFSVDWNPKNRDPAKIAVTSLVQKWRGNDLS